MKILNKFICITVIIISFLSFDRVVFANQSKNVSNVVIFAKFNNDNKDIFNAKGKLNNWEYIKQIYDKDLDPNDSTRDKSFKNYINKISEGKINVQNYFPQENITKDSVKTYTLANNESYYSTSSMIVSEIIKAIKDSKIQFDITNEKLDNTYPGVLDTLTIIVQGDSNEKCASIYPHKANYAGSETIKSLRISNYIILPSRALVMDDASDTTITRERGTVAHEFLHTLGMPDLYSNSSGNNPVGNWCIMSKTGMYFRYPLSYLRAEQGWIDKNYITKSGTYKLNAVSKDGDKKIYIIKTPLKDSEYIVLEYRKKTKIYADSYDFEYGIPDSGLLVYRVNENIESKSNLNNENYIYVYRNNTTSRDAADGDIYSAMIKANTSETYGNTNLSINYDNDKNILYYSDGTNSGIKISEVKTTSNDENEISFKVEFADYNTSNLWENIGLLTSNADGSPDLTLYTDKINNVIYSAYTEGTYNSSSSKVIIKKFDGTNWINVGNSINGMKSADIINFKGNMYLVCINQTTGHPTYYKLQNSNWIKVSEISSNYVEKVKFIEDSNSLYAMYIESGSNKKLVLKDLINNNIIIEKTSNEFCNPDLYKDNNKIYLVYSTFAGSNSTGLIDSYDINTKKWTNEQKLSKFSNVNIIKKYNDKLYVLMGESTSTPTILIYNGKDWIKKDITSIKTFMSASMNIINNDVYISYYDTADNNKIKILKVSNNIELFNDTLGNEYSNLNVVTDKDNKYMYAILQSTYNSANIIVKRYKTKIENNEEEPKLAEIKIDSIKLNKTSITLNIGETTYLTSTIIPSNTTYDKTVTYISSNTNIASVDKTGKITAKKAGNITIIAKTSNGKTATCTITIKEKPQAKKVPNVVYQTHIQNIGWQSYVKNSSLAGTTGRSLRLEAIRIKLDNNEYEGNIEYQTHIQNIGWQNYVKNNSLSGTSGRSLRLEAIRIKLTGEIKNYYDVYYRVHTQNIGWMGWAKNGESAGSAGYSYRLEGIQIVLVKKGDKAPGSTANSYTQKYINYQTHIQNIGWQGYVYDGKTSGTSGKALRLEAIRIKLENQEYKGNIEYQTHIQNIGWQNYVKNGSLSGTSGRALRLEAIRIKLTGEIANYYDVYYRVHTQNIGWMGWAKNGESAGSAGYSYRLEAIQIILVKKGEKAPGSTINHFKSR